MYFWKNNKQNKQTIMKKLYTYLIAFMAMTGLASNANAQADLAAMSDKYTADEMQGGYMLSVYFQNVGDALYNDAIKVTLGIYNLDGTLVMNASANISASNIEPGSDAAIGAYIHKDTPPYNTYLTPGSVYNIKCSLIDSPDGNAANDVAWLMDGTSKFEFHYYPGETPDNGGNTGGGDEFDYEEVDGTGTVNGVDLTFSEGTYTAAYVDGTALRVMFYYLNKGKSDFTGKVPMDLVIMNESGDEIASSDLTEMTTTEDKVIGEGNTKWDNYGLTLSSLDGLPDGKYKLGFRIKNVAEDVDDSNNEYTFLTKDSEELVLTKTGASYVSNGTEIDMDGATGGTTGVKLVGVDDSGLNIFPNPVIENATLEFALANNSNVSLEIYNAIGELVQVVENAVLSAGTHTYQINTAQLNRGMYFYVLKTNEGRVAKRFVKQ